MTKRILLFLILFAAVSSCTVQKRLYNKGFHVEFRKQVKESEHHSNKNYFAEVSQTESEVLLPDSIFTSSNPEEFETDEVISSPTANAPDLKPTAISSFQSKRKDPEKNPKSIFMQVHVKESVMYKSLQEGRMLSTTSSDIDWEDTLITVGSAILIIILLILYFTFPTFALILEIIFAILLLVALVMLIVWLCGALNNIEWFWSGR